MRYILQGLLILTLFSVVADRALSRELKAEFQGTYEKPTIDQRLLSDHLALEDTERDDYATNLASYVVSQVRKHSGSQESLKQARNILGLALHLSPRNKKCVVVNAQLAKGVFPAEIAGDYKVEVFSGLLLARGQVLEKSEQELNRGLARYFIDLAAIIDPRNEDAVYESELRRIDHGDLSWEQFVESK